MTWVFYPPAVVAARSLARSSIRCVGLWQLRTVIVGPEARASQAKAALLSEPGLGYLIAGVVDPPALNTPQEGLWRGILAQYQAELLVLTFDTQDPRAVALARSLLCERIPIALIPSLGGLSVLGFEQTHFFSHDLVMFTYANNMAQPLSRGTKIVFDIIAALLILLFISPALLAIALAAKLDGGPVCFAHRRIGAGGREFKCLKFRSMKLGTDELLQQILASDAGRRTNGKPPTNCGKGDANRALLTQDESGRTAAAFQYLATGNEPGRPSPHRRCRGPTLW